VLELGCLPNVVLSWGERTELLHLCIDWSLELGFPWKAVSRGRQPRLVIWLPSQQLGNKIFIPEGEQCPLYLPCAISCARSMRVGNTSKQAITRRWGLDERGVVCGTRRTSLGLAGVGFGRKSCKVTPEGRGTVRKRQVEMMCMNAKGCRGWLLQGSKVRSLCLECHWE